MNIDNVPLLQVANNPWHDNPWHDNNAEHDNENEIEEEGEGAGDDEDAGEDHTLQPTQKDDGYSVWLRVLYNWFQSDEQPSLTPTPSIRSLICECLQNEKTNENATIFSSIPSSDTVTVTWNLFQSKSLPIRHLLSSFLQSHEMADISLCIPEQDIGILCHGWVLSANSEFFKALLSVNWTPQEQEDVSNTTGARRTIPCDADSQHIQLLLRYFYGEDIFTETLSVYDAVGVYALAHFWACPPSTLEEIERHVYNTVVGASSVYVLTFADTFSLARLKDKCFTLAIKEMTFREMTYTENEDASPAFPVLAAEVVQECMATLRRACTLVKSKHNYDVDCSVREMVAILREALLEEEEMWRTSVSRHEEEMRAVTSCPRTESTENAADSEYMQRLLKVQLSLDNQERAIRARRLFYEQQERSIRQLGL